MENEALNPAETTIRSNEPGFGSRFINIFVNPQKTFESLNRRPTWLIPMLIIMALVVISTQLTFPQIIDAQLEMYKNNPNISTEQLNAIEQQLNENMQTQRILMTVAPLIFIPLVYYLLLAGIFYFVGSVILGGDSTFKKVLSVWSWSSLIGIVGTIVTIPLIIAKGTLKVTLSPALLLPGDAIDTTLYTLLSKFDFFTIWTLAVFAYGFVTIYRFSVSKGYIAIGVLWGIWIAISVVFAETFKQFGM
ncbi:MAG: YIP1 family protein [candidate division Zixibacteria bacterium]|nr:YIP1 family protein [candidate division Zixibacteria bacterium]